MTNDVVNSWAGLQRLRPLNAESWIPRCDRYSEKYVILLGSFICIVRLYNVHRCNEYRSRLYLRLIMFQVENRFTDSHEIVYERYDTGSHPKKSYIPISNSSVGITMSYRLDDRGLIPGRGKRFVYIPQCPEHLWVPPNLSLNTEDFFLGVKRSGREADHSPPSSTEDKNGGATPPVSRTSSWRGA
jgi:hypothetical protein